MLFVSGAWTLAAITPLISRSLRPFVVVTVTAANVSLLATLLAAMLLYSEVGPRPTLKKAMVVAFSAGILTLIISIVLFSAQVLMAPPAYPD